MITVTNAGDLYIRCGWLRYSSYSFSGAEGCNSIRWGNPTQETNKRDYGNKPPPPYVIVELDAGCLLIDIDIEIGNISIYVYIDMRRTE
jgi:hypothetical protein